MEITERLVPPTKLWEGNVIVLECPCGAAVNYPGHPDDAEVTTCGECGVAYRVVPLSRRAESEGDAVMFARELRDLFLAFIVDHERTHHAGEPCTTNRVEALAYLAHAMGLSADLADDFCVDFTLALRIYDQEHDLRTHHNGHHREDGSP